MKKRYSIFHLSDEEIKKDSKINPHKYSFFPKKLEGDVESRIKELTKDIQISNYDHSDSFRDAQSERQEEKLSQDHDRYLNDR